jgi:uroporphyrinogen decarboxylase
MLHICGDTTKILNDMTSSGTDAVELDFKTDIRKIHAVCSRTTTLSGTIDPTGVLAHGTPAAVEAAVREILDVYQDSPRLIVNAGCAIPPMTPAENMRALIRAARGG